MIAKMHALTHMTKLGHLFDQDSALVTFESDVSMREVFDSFTKYLHECVLITENTVHVGILTLKDMMRILQNFENLLRPVREFMVTPLITFDAMQSIGDVLNSDQNIDIGKIVVKECNRVIGIIDYSDLLSLCFTKITPLIKHEYNLLNAVLGMADEGGRRLLKLATSDPLTGIGNRRLLEEIFQAHQMISGKEDIQPFLLLFDIDNFKQINDTYGHNVGDGVLKELTRLVSNSVRRSDIFVRWGGEEFALLLRYSDSTTVMNLAEHIRNVIEQFRFESNIRITCSFGLSAVLNGESLEMAIGHADRALYQAKADGKNCIRINVC